jgi:hypothetical protein
VWNHLPLIQCARRPHIGKRQMDRSRERVSAASCGSLSVVSFPLRVLGRGRGLYEPLNLCPDDDDEHVSRGRVSSFIPLRIISYISWEVSGVLHDLCGFSEVSWHTSSDITQKQKKKMFNQHPTLQSSYVRCSQFGLASCESEYWCKCLRYFCHNL